ncbi:hypothetical protein [Pleionea sp. CnH1-48]|uniref:hypothetical protein n=1 Tax=Pleionea sp. CnH1-48 TaxID=2954494 RepID=UPI0020980AB1|nr:hypothetical protein [Pleionea sp. CnH1-48]MCO7224762.1 hypothetical protein [Pleionea sp. CnH1-48]
MQTSITNSTQINTSPKPHTSKETSNKTKESQRLKLKPIETQRKIPTSSPSSSKALTSKLTEPASKSLTLKLKIQPAPVLQELEVVKMDEFKNSSPDGKVVINDEHNTLYVLYDSEAPDEALDSISSLKDNDSHKLSPRPQSIITKGFVKDEHGDIFKAYRFNAQLFPKKEIQEIEHNSSQAKKYDEKSFFPKLMSSSQEKSAQKNLEKTSEEVLDPQIKKLPSKKNITRYAQQSLVMKNDCGNVATILQQLMRNENIAPSPSSQIQTLSNLNESTERKLAEIKLQPGDKMVCMYKGKNPTGCKYHAVTVVMADKDYIVCAEGHAGIEYKEPDLHIYKRGALGFVQSNLEALNKLDKEGNGQQHLDELKVFPARENNARLERMKTNSETLKSALSEKNIPEMEKILKEKPMLKGTILPKETVKTSSSK